MERLGWPLILGIVLLMTPQLGCGDEGPWEPEESEGGAGGDGGGEAGAGGSGGEGGGGEGGGGSPKVPYDFDCTEPAATLGDVIYTECEESNSEGPFECGLADVPLDWCDPESERISFHFRRFPHRAETSLGQIWILPGGPGHASNERGHLATDMRNLGFDVFMPDYRGLGKSTSLNCPGGVAGVATGQCLSDLHRMWGYRLRYFSTTGAVFDIGAVIDRVRNQDESLFIIGTSYGSFVANRYLHLFPEQPTGVIMDGICHGARCEIFFDKNRERVVLDVMEWCGTDPFCSSKLTSDPVAWLTELVHDVRDGHCSEAFGDETEARLAEILTTNINNRHSLIVGLSFAYRLRRCDPADLDALHHHVLGPASTDVVGELLDDSIYLYFNIFLNEFWPEGYTLAQAEADAEAMLLRGERTVTLARNRSIWPWPFFDMPDELKSWAPTDVPLLMFNGALDVQTPISAILDIEDAFPLPHQRFVPIPWGPHNNLWQTEYEGQPLGEACVGGILFDFLQDPQAELDTSCVETLLRPGLVGSESVAQQVFGTTDVWENEAEEEDEE